MIYPINQNMRYIREGAHLSLAFASIRSEWHSRPLYSNSLLWFYNSRVFARGRERRANSERKKREIRAKSERNPSEKNANVASCIARVIRANYLIRASYQSEILRDGLTDGSIIAYCIKLAVISLLKHESNRYMTSQTCSLQICSKRKTDRRADGLTNPLGNPVPRLMNKIIFLPTVDILSNGIILYERIVKSNYYNELQCSLTHSHSHKDSDTHIQTQKHIY